MNNTLPINMSQNVTMRISANPGARKGGVPYRSVLDVLSSDTAPHPVIVDVVSGHHGLGRSYSEAQIRLSEDQKRHLAARIEYSEPLGMFTPKEGRFMINPRTLPAENLKIHWGDQYAVEPEWYIEVTLPVSTLEDDKHQWDCLSVVTDMRITYPPNIDTKK